MHFYNNIYAMISGEYGSNTNWIKILCNKCQCRKQRIKGAIQGEFDEIGDEEE